MSNLFPQSVKAVLASGLVLLPIEDARAGDVPAISGIITVSAFSGAPGNERISPYIVVDNSFTLHDGVCQFNLSVPREPFGNEIFIVHINRALADCAVNKSGTIHIFAGRFGPFGRANVKDFVGLWDEGQTPSDYGFFRSSSPLFWYVFPDQDGFGTQIQLNAHTTWTQHITWADHGVAGLPLKSNAKPTFYEQYSFNYAHFYADVEAVDIEATGEKRLTTSVGVSERLNDKGLTFHAAAANILFAGGPRHPDAWQTVVGLTQPLDPNNAIKLNGGLLRSAQGLDIAKADNQILANVTLGLYHKFNRSWSVDTGASYAHTIAEKKRPKFGAFIGSARLNYKF